MAGFVSMHALRPSTSQNKKYDPMPKSAFEVALSQMSNEELLPAVVNREKETLAQRKARFEKDALVFTSAHTFFTKLTTGRCLQVYTLFL